MIFSNITEDTTPTNDDYIIGVNADGVDFKATLANVMKALYPVGSLYFNAAVDTNPATLLGFGTWSPYAAGEMLVGVNPSDPDFETVGNTGGEKTHLLSWNEMPSHNHGINDSGHTHASNTAGETVFTAGSTQHVDTSGAGQQITWGNTTTGSSGTGVSVQFSGDDQPHNNMPPYIAVYIWQRTA